MYKQDPPRLYSEDMDVTVTALRANLSEWLDRARAGDDVVVTDRGTPVARLVGVEHATPLDRLTEQGVISRPRGSRPTAAGRSRPTATRPMADHVSDGRR